MFQPAKDGRWQQVARLTADAPEGSSFGWSSARVARDFTEMKAAGTTVARIHPEMPRVRAAPDKANPPALAQLRELLKIAENSAIHLKKPIVIGETFPLSCGVEDERAFLLQSREFAHGWIGHWPDESPAQLAELKQAGKATLQNAIWLSGVDLFQAIGPQLIGATSK